jgi:hypothetical protein
MRKYEAGSGTCDGGSTAATAGNVAAINVKKRNKTALTNSD